MKPTGFLLITCLYFLGTVKLQAQTNQIYSDKVLTVAAPEDAVVAPSMNLVKLNLTAIILKNYSIQYERVLSKPISVAVSFRLMPSTSIPFKDIILEEVGDDDPDTKEVIENLKVSNFAITPEVRFYVGRKGYGRGFYIAPFYRFASFKTNNLIFDFQNSANQESNISLSGTVTAHTGGLMFGAQWLLGKNMCLDWWILGPHYGAGKGDLSGLAKQPLTPDEQTQLRNELEDLDIPLTDKTVTVNASGAAIQLNGPWAGVRAGISLGIRF